MKISIRSLTCLLFVLASVLVTVKSLDNPPAGPPQPVDGTETEQPGTTFPEELETVSYYTLIAFFRNEINPPSALSRAKLCPMSKDWNFTQAWPI